MSNKPPRNTYTPLTEVTSSDSSVIIGSILPQYINAGRIGIDLEALERIRKISGIAGISIMRAKVGNDDVPQIGSVDHSGNATAGISLSAVKSKDISKRDMIHSDLIPPGYKPEKYINLHLDVDTEAMAKELLEKGMLSSVSAWAEALDKNLAQRILNQASLGLLTPYIMDVALSVTSMALAAIHTLRGKEDMAQFFVDWFSREVWMSVFKCILPMLRRDGHGRSDFSPFGVEIIRLFTIQIIRLQSHKLISEIVDIDE